MDICLPSAPKLKLSNRKGTKNKQKNSARQRGIQKVVVIAVFLCVVYNVIIVVRNVWTFLSHPSASASVFQAQNLQDGKNNNNNYNQPLISLPRHSKQKQKELVEFENKKDDLLFSSWHYPYIHIVNTRFMQDQPGLLHLAQARLHLFETFCLPSMILQSTSISLPHVDEFVQEEFFRKHPELKSKLKFNENKKDKNNDQEWIELQKFLETQKFLWIIKTDPNLEPKMVQQLQKLLEPYPNFYLVGSNTNFGVGSKHGSWRDGQAGESVLSLLQSSTSTTTEMDMDSGTNTNINTNTNSAASMIYTGDTRLLKLAHEYREDRVVIETRLDADDGLHRNYLSTIQNKVMDTFGLNNENLNPDTKLTSKNQQDIKWKYWCASDHLEWFSDSNPKSTNGTALDTYPGSLHKPDNFGECITPGISLAIGIGVEEEEVQRSAHHKLVNTIWNKGQCGAKDRQACLQFLHTMDSDNFDGKNLQDATVPKIMAVRARTPTSAGMKDVSMNSKAETDINDALISNEDKKKSDEVLNAKQMVEIKSLWWENLDQNFGIKKDRAKITNTYLQEHLIEIAIDNIKGQGTAGHSSKISSKDKLQAMVDILMADKHLIPHNYQKLAPST